MHILSDLYVSMCYKPVASSYLLLEFLGCMRWSLNSTKVDLSRIGYREYGNNFT